MLVRFRHSLACWEHSGSIELQAAFVKLFLYGAKSTESSPSPITPGAHFAQSSLLLILLHRFNALIQPSQWIPFRFCYIIVALIVSRYRSTERFVERLVSRYLPSVLL